MEFLLKWKGYPESENTWEPLSNLSCSKLLKQYMLKHRELSSTNLCTSTMSTSSSDSQAKKSGLNPARKPRKPEVAKGRNIAKKQSVKTKLPRKRSPCIPSNTKGRANAKNAKVIDRAICRPINHRNHHTTSNRIHHSQVSGESKKVTASAHSNIRTQAQTTAVTISSSIQDVDRIANSIRGDDSDNDSVVIARVDPPRYHLSPTTPTLSTFSLNHSQHLSPTELYFSIMSLKQQVSTNRYSSTSQSSPSCNSYTSNCQGLRRTDSGSSTTLSANSDTSATLTASSTRPSPLLDSPVSDNSFKLQLSSESGSAGECESPYKSTLGERINGASLPECPLRSHFELLTALSSNRAGTEPRDPGSQDILSKLSRKRSKKRLSTNSHRINNKVASTSRRGRMGPVPRPCQPVRNQLTSLQTKAAKEPIDSSSKAVGAQSHPIKVQQLPNNGHISVIFKFNGTCNRFVVQRHNSYVSIDDSDTDSSTDSSIVERINPSKPKIQRTRTSLLSTTNLLASSTECSKKAASRSSSTKRIARNGLLSTLVRTAHSVGDEDNENLSANDISLECEDSIHDSLASSLSFHPQQEPLSHPRLRSSSVLSTESVHYKQLLLNWQFELNRQRGGTDDIIFVENEIDRAMPPENFTYICSNKYGEGVPDPSLPDVRDSLCGCQCYHLGKRCGPRAPYCCSTLADVPFAYTPAGKVCVTPGTPIYECNSKCSCPMDCANRVVQHGRKIPLCIFRTVNRGWGVKTLQSIKANTFITEYVGEVITSEEAEKRGKTYDDEGETYLFDLDFDDDQMFTIDAKNYGNISHFFNHSVSALDHLYVLYSS